MLYCEEKEIKEIKEIKELIAEEVLALANLSFNEEGSTEEDDQAANNGDADWEDDIPRRRDPFKEVVVST